MKRHCLPASADPRTRAIRLGATPAERRLWLALREGLPEARFRGQVPIGPYVADFCSQAAKLVVEVEGSQHPDRGADDSARTRFLEREGYRVLRFRNDAVTENLDGVLTAILAALPDDLPPRQRVREEQAGFMGAGSHSPLPAGDEAAAGRGATQGPARAEAVQEFVGAFSALRAPSLRDGHPLPSLPHKGEGGIVKPPVWSL
jgi:very-short-patch-repair endonuclease